MEAVFKPGMTAPAHLHSGPEAWYALGGETCLETSDGRMQIGRAGGPAVIAPMGLAMHLTAIGTEQRRSIVLILHQSSEPATTMVHDWTPKGLCRNKN
jgi:quercetin dioxygenase-like cupin family protein